MLGIIANFVAYLLFGVLAMTSGQGLHIFLCIVIFALIVFGFNYCRAARSETDASAIL